MVEGVPFAGLSSFCEDEVSRLGSSRHSADRFAEHHLLCSSQEEKTVVELGRSRSCFVGYFQQVGHFVGRTEASERCCGRCGDGFGEREDHFSRHLAKGRGYILLVQRGGKAISRACKAILGKRCSGRRQLLCSSQFGSLFGRQLLLYPQGSALSYGTIDLFQDKRRRNGSV